MLGRNLARNTSSAKEMLMGNEGSTIFSFSPLLLSYGFSDWSGILSEANYMSLGREVHSKVGRYIPVKVH